MSNVHNLPRMPLNMRHPELAKAGPQKNESFEPRPSKHHETGKYNYQGQDRPNTHMMSIIRRNPNGELDYQWAKNMVIDAIHNLHHEFALLPIHMALVTIIFPGKTKGQMEPMEADLKTQFSDSEKRRVRELVEAQMRAETDWNAGRGGGSVPNRTVTRDGTP